MQTRACGAHNGTSEGQLSVLMQTCVCSTQNGISQARISPNIRLATDVFEFNFDIIYF